MPFFQESTSTFTYKDYAVGTPVAVIAAFKPNGAIKPLRIRIETLEGAIETNVAHVIDSEKTNYNLYTFKCCIVNNDTQYTIKLTYNTDTNVWKVIK